MVAAHHLPAGANDPSYARIESFTGKVDGILIGEGIVPSPFIERLATRLPVVIFAGTPHEQAVDVVAADNLSGSAAVVTHLIRDHGRRRLFWVHGPGGLAGLPRAAATASTTCCTPARTASSPGSTRGFYSVQSGEEAGESLLAMAPARSCRTRSSPPTTRWPSAWSRR